MEENNAFQEKNTRKQASLFSFFGGGKKTAQVKRKEIYFMKREIEEKKERFEKKYIL